MKILIKSLIEIKERVCQYRDKLFQIRFHSQFQQK